MFPSDLFVQKVNINVECFKTTFKLNIVLGINDSLLLPFGEANWTFMNGDWLKFREKTKNLIDDTDLWDRQIGSNERCLRNAKLYPIFNLSHVKALKTEMRDFNQFFWINSQKMSEDCIKMWKQSYRISIEDILKSSDISKVFQNRRNIFNLVNIKTLVKSVVLNKAIQFNDIIRNAVLDGYSTELLKLFDEGNHFFEPKCVFFGINVKLKIKAAIQNSSDLILLPRLMAFISTTLCEMAADFKSVRSGPSLNLNWMHAYQLIDNSQIEMAILELSKVRQNWMHRNDLLIRASRHYEGAMLSFIRQATSCFKTSVSESNVNLEFL